MKRFNAKYAPFWYHPDHLGSSSYITNLGGEINQHMEYLPFGELLVEEHLNSYNSPFKFNAKEFDAETGNYYYGARYYDPKWVIWLSVDAEFARFPSYSPYNYTLLNPINLVDPDGNAPQPPGFPTTNPFIGVTLKILGALFTNSEKTKKPHNSSRERPRSSGVLGVGIEFQGNKKGIVEVPIAEKGTKVLTADGETVNELTNVYGPQLPGGGTALVPDGEGFSENSERPIENAESYKIIYTAEGEATPGSLYGSAATEKDRGVVVRNQSTTDLKVAERDSAALTKQEGRLVVPGTVQIKRDTISN